MSEEYKCECSIILDHIRNLPRHLTTNLHKKNMKEIQRKKEERDKLKQEIIKEICAEGNFNKNINEEKKEIDTNNQLDNTNKINIEKININNLSNCNVNL